jgi:sugar O-acyltransferase (sialic acid O-acetyltransferase NeuD family)
MNTLAILGAGGFAREVYWHLKTGRCLDEVAGVVFVDDVTPITKIRMHQRSCMWDVPVVRDWNFSRYQCGYGPVRFIVGTGSPQTNKIMVERARDAGLLPLPTFVHPRALVQNIFDIGVGGIITPGCVLTTGIHIGDYVVLNLNCTVGHDASIDEYSVCLPGSHISGNVHLSERCMIGSGAVIREKISVAPDTIIGAQACVVKDINKPNTTVVGVPAKEREVK